MYIIVMMLLIFGVFSSIYSPFIYPIAVECSNILINTNKTETGTAKMNPILLVMGHTDVTSNRAEQIKVYFPLL